MWILALFRERRFPRVLDIPRGFSQLLSGLVPATRPLGLDRGNGAVCKITTELNAALEVDVLLSFCFDIQSLLSSMTSIGWGCAFLSSSAAKSASKAPDLFWLVDNRRLLRGAISVGGGGDMVMLRLWFQTRYTCLQAPYPADIFLLRQAQGFLSERCIH